MAPSKNAISPKPPLPRSESSAPAAASPPAAKFEPPPEFDRHRRKCSICHHPERDAIEAAFLRWSSTDVITRQFELEDWRVIYRHAHAAGLFEKRRKNFRCALENILEEADQIQVTGSTFIRAVRAYACLTESGQWIEPPKRVIVITHNAASESAADPPAPGIQIVATPAPHLAAESFPGVLTPPRPSGEPISNRQYAELEPELNHRKQTSGGHSNRQ